MQTENAQQQELLKKDSKNIQNMFSSIARFYDFLNHLLSLNLDQSWRRFAVSVSVNDAPNNAKALDVCTGTSDLAIAYSKELNKDGLVFGSDFCHEMLRYGNIKLRKLGLNNKIRLMESDTLNLPFQDNKFNISSVGFGIRNVSNLEKGITEMQRVIVPGGKVVILEFSQPTNPLFRSLYFFYFKKILPIIGNILSKSKDNAYTYLRNSVLSFPDRQKLKEIMESCGLTDVKIYPRTFGIVTIHVGTKK